MRTPVVIDGRMAINRRDGIVYEGLTRSPYLQVGIIDEHGKPIHDERVGAQLDQLVETMREQRFVRDRHYPLGLSSVRGRSRVPPWPRVRLRSYNDR